MTKIVGDKFSRDLVAFERDGACVIRGVLEVRWIELMRAGIEIALSDTQGVAQERAAEKHGRFHNGFFHWKKNRSFESFLFGSEVVEIAAQLMRATQVNLFYDQLFVKEPKTPVETPWHSDFTFFPVTGGKLISIWVPFDPVSSANGAVRFIKGSHLWPDLNARIAEITKNGVKAEDYDILSWELDPGDVLAFDLRTIHGSGGNQSTFRRRALSSRWVDQDARYAPFDGDIFSWLRRAFPNAPEIDVDTGEPFDSALFRRAWPRREG
jgi:ectoine hydroxylase-related dioxygenase (phytanoyl-CoA dioxygenase family)